VHQQFINLGKKVGRFLVAQLEKDGGMGRKVGSPGRWGKDHHRFKAAGANWSRIRVRGRVAYDRVHGDHDNTRSPSGI